jgi:peptidoglycan/LPS O-acetylase OafA/YrhL
MSTTALQMEPGRNDGLKPRSGHIDAVRGLAILGVVQSHYFALTNIYDWLGFPKPLVNVLTAGTSGVDLFFVVSAFLLCRGLLEAKGNSLTILNFYCRRVLRILPAYWLLLMLGFGFKAILNARGGWASWLWGGIYDPISYLIFFQNWLIGRDGFWHGNVFAHTWSLAVEEQFYIVLPLVVGAAGKRGLVLIACLMILSGIPARIMFGNLVSDVAAHTWSLARLDAFGWGILLALIVFQWPTLSLRLRPTLLAGTTLTLFIVYTGMFFTRFGNSVQVAIYLAVIDMLAAMLVLAAAIASKGMRTERHIVHRSLAWMGERCYSIYLFHNLVFGLILIERKQLWPSGGSVAVIACVVFAFIITLCIADVSYRRVEQPFISLGRTMPNFFTRLSSLFPRVQKREMA